MILFRDVLSFLPLIEENGDVLCTIEEEIKSIDEKGNKKYNDSDYLKS